jgi:molecular chaperone DnaK
MPQPASLPEGERPQLRQPTLPQPGAGFGEVALPPWTPPVPAGIPQSTLAGGTPHAVARSSVRPLSQPQAPVLVDVTPLTLCVETVSGYCDPLIERNTPVPCERTRDFVTVADNQTSVRVRIGQGQSGTFKENTLLGELELSGLRAAARGQVQISVTFALDTSGILNVSARDLGTGRHTSAQMRLVGLPDASEIDALSARHAAHPAG